MFGRLSLPLNDEAADYAALVVANRMLGGDSRSRMFKRVRVQEGLSYAVGSRAPAGVDRSEQHVRRLRHLRAAEPREGARGHRGGVARAREDGFTEQEVAAAKKALLEERRIARAQDDALAGALVSQAYLGRTWAQSAKIDAAIAAVTVAVGERGAAQVRDPPESHSRMRGFRKAK